MSEELTDLETATKRFYEAGVVWAATGHGKPLVDAAVDALMVGLDTPSLVLLAGAQARFADEDASELAVDVFDELGLEVPEKFSEGAYIALARLRSQHFLRRDMTARELAAELWSLYSASGYSDKLAGASGLDDWYSLLDDGVIPHDEAASDRQVRQCAEELAAGSPPSKHDYWNRGQ